MEHQTCAGCGATLPRTGTYCLACDTPVVETTSRLSVGDTQVVAHGRPLLGVALVALILLLAGAATWGTTTLLHRHQHQHEDRTVSTSAIKGAEIVVSAESGKTGGCPYVGSWMAGDPQALEHDCLALGGTDPGAHLRRMHATAVHRHGAHATVTLAATLVDHRGHRPWTRTLALEEQHDDWLVDWDGTALAATG